MLNRILCAFALSHQKKPLLFDSLCFTLLWGLLAHAYGLLNPLFAHDSAAEFFFPHAHKIQLGRFFAPLYTQLAVGEMTLPWLGGLLGLLWIALAVFLTAELFQMPKRSSVFWLAGIFTANRTVTALLATYNHDFGADMFALLLATAAGYWWYRHEGSAILLGGVLVFGALGLYQSYVSVTVAYLMLASILSLLRQQSSRQVVKKGLWGIAMLLLGGLLYCLALRLIPILTGISIRTGGYNTLDAMSSLSFRALPSRLYSLYVDFLFAFFLPSGFPTGFMLLAHIGFAGLAGTAIVKMLGKKELSRSGKGLVLLLGLLLPLGMNLSYLLSGFAHDLMQFAFWFLYVLVLLLLEWAKLRKGCLFSGLCLFVILWGNAQTANGAYLVKDLQQDSVKSFFVQVEMDLLEQENYQPGESPVLFIGESDCFGTLDWKYHRSITGLPYHPFGYRLAMVGYCRDVLGLPILFCDEQDWNAYQTDPRTADMSCYPQEGSIQVLDGIFIVKLGEVADG